MCRAKESKFGSVRGDVLGYFCCQGPIEVGWVQGGSGLGGGRVKQERLLLLTLCFLCNEVRWILRDLRAIPSPSPLPP